MRRFWSTFRPCFVVRSRGIRQDIGVGGRKVSRALGGDWGKGRAKAPKRMSEQIIAHTRVVICEVFAFPGARIFFKSRPTGEL
jgi:hypothetical protein